MGWDDFNSSYNWTKILDGETQVIVPFGEPEIQEKADGNKSILFNIYNDSKGIHEVLRCGVVLAGKIKGALKGGKLLGKSQLVVSRTGSSMEDTEYTVKAEDITEEAKAAVKVLEPHDLSVIPLPEESRRKRGAGKGKTKAKAGKKG